MAEMNSQEFAPNNFSAPHRRRAVGVLIVALIVFGIILLAFFLKPSATPPLSDSLAARQALLAQPNPPANLTPDEIAARQKLMNAPNPPSKLTPEQIKARQTLMENN